VAFIPAIVPRGRAIAGCSEHVGQIGLERAGTDRMLPPIDANYAIADLDRARRLVGDLLTE
jgi:hypothetical protein